MTRSGVIGVLRSNLTGLHYQSASTICLRRLGNSTRQYAADSTTSTHSSAPRHFSRYKVVLRNHTLRRFHQPAPCSTLPSRSGARPFSHFGPAERQSPSDLLPYNPGPSSLNRRFCSGNNSNLLPRTQESNIGSWSAAIIIGLVSGAALYTVSSGDIGRLNEQRKSHSSEVLPAEFESEGIGRTNNMTGESLPGRPGTLTAEQEEKLREFWIATLQVFGVLDANELNGNGNAEPARADTSVSKKPKKKRLSLFRSKRHDDDTASTTSTESSSHTAAGSGDSDDKYGQTKEFHEALAKLSPESLRAAFWSMVKHDHPDALLLRFLRARKWDVEKALVMMVSTMRWRATEMHVDDDIMKNGELASLEAANGSDPEKKKLGEDFLAQMRLGKSFLHGLDNEGRPMCFVRVRLHKQGEQSEASLERYTVFVIECARMVLAPPVDTACVVFDMTGFSMANMDYAPVKFMIKCFEANYPESLGVVLVHKAPWIFQGIWKIIKGWLDPVVASKVHFTNNEEEMEKYVPKSHVLKDLGGDEDWAYHYIEPVVGENDTMKDTETRDKLLAGREDIVKDYEKATLDWIHGQVDSAEIKKKRDELANSLKDDYWRLDSYVRARSYYDRVGMLNSGGRLQFYPQKTAPPTTNGSKVETSADDVD